uniref:Uncharacterized protein n=1 Tax=Siphoviridae sp. ctepM7 TaxID=2826408 RepID=A0A8S5N9T3_9CAUD|nr:MAG TPA: hypothetical protein [Siphoviridae sp. ctepM7]DAX86439.1 MAG TPA: hypothetical protein [Caudoviricetes sp.]
MTWYERIIAAHRAVTDAVSHAARVKSERYFVWQEDGSNDLAGDNGHSERVMTGTTDLYTKQELDPWADALGESFDAHGISWALNSVQYEADTGFYHYEWVWEAL